MNPLESGMLKKYLAMAAAKSGELAGHGVNAVEEMGRIGDQAGLLGKGVEAFQQTRQAADEMRQANALRDAIIGGGQRAAAFNQAHGNKVIGGLAAGAGGIGALAAYKAHKKRKDEKEQ